MSGARIGTALLALASGGLLATAAGAVDPAVKADAKAFGQSLLPGARNIPRTPVDAATLPNYTPPGANPQEAYWSNPGRLDTDAATAGPGHAGYDTMRSSMSTRATFPKADLDAVVARGKAVQDDPTTYVSGYGGTPGTCRPLPRPMASPGTYEQSCNVGFIEGSSTPTCSISLQVTTKAAYRYECSDNPMGNMKVCDPLYAAGCSYSGSRPGPCLQWSGPPNNRWCSEPGDPIFSYTCSAEVAGYNAVSISRVVDKVTKNDSACASYAANAQCTQQGETCIDSDPVQRIIDGLPVTQACWGWNRTYQCTSMTPAQDCSQLEGMGCSFLREQCLTGDNPCSTSDRVYACPIPPEPQGSQQYICDGDVYCINGDCDKIDRTPNNEFGQAVVALNAANDARKTLDPNQLTVFKGTKYGCTKAIFGISNCCSPRGFPLIGACGPDARVLKEQREKGVCHYVGTYCSSKALFVCIEKREVHCCYGSKLARILQEQGKPQLGLTWASDPKNETCAGFTVDQFSRLDLSRMDFSEVLAEFTDAAKLPDEMQTATELQGKIRDYYAAHGG